MTSNNVVAIIQARMSSSRLPGKVLQDIGGEPMLVRVVERARRAKTVRQVVVATTGDPSDDPIQALCEARGYAYYRGSLFDVLDRFYQAARQFQADTIVRLTADCPLIDPLEIDHVVEEFFAQGVDFAANRLPPPWKRTYPIGLDTEVCSFPALERAWKEATQAHEREHVLPYLYTEPGRFRTLLVNTSPDYGDLRWTVDTSQDLELVRRIFAHFGGRDDFSWQAVLKVFQEHPELAEINSGVSHKVFNDVDKRFQDR